MKKHNYLLVLLVPFFSFAQSKQERIAIMKKNDSEVLNQLAIQFSAEHLEREERIKAHLLKHPELSRILREDGVLKEIYDILPNGIIEYYMTSNAGSAVTSRASMLYNGGELGINVQGQGMVAYVWDGGSPRTTHVEFPNNKVYSADGASQDSHGAHVMGTIVAQGIVPRLRGVAFEASGVSYDWNADLAEIVIEADLGMLVSNHSYGTSLNATYIFGAYNGVAKSFDQIAVAAPYYLAVTAAGNDRNDFLDAEIGPYLALKSGYNLIKGMQNAKNILTVGAVYNVSNYNVADVVMSNFSSWGPTDDGRIKPDIVTKGVGVRSTTIDSDTSSGSNQGTSMASPGVAGVALLLQQYYNMVNNEFMLAATLKGLMLHTADEAGAADGPDYSFGWGLVNAAKAAIVIKNSQEQTALLSELTLQSGVAYTTTIAATGTKPLMVSISWTDPAGPSNNSVVDPDILYLKNDLDVRVTKDGEVFYPWTLNPAVPDGPAVRNTDNFRDNFEKIQIDNPNGVYTITVTNKGTITSNGGKQNFSLIASSDNGITLTSSNFSLNETSLFLYPNPAAELLNYSFSTDVNLNSVNITDVSGKKVLVKSSDFSNSQLDISQLSSGIYFVNFSAEQGSFTKKFIKN